MKHKMDLFIFPGVQDHARSYDSGSCQDHGAYTCIQYDDWSQDLDPGLQEESMNPFCISFGKACSEYGTHSVDFLGKLEV